MRRALPFRRPERLTVEQRKELVRLPKAGALAANYFRSRVRCLRLRNWLEVTFTAKIVCVLLRRLLKRLGWSERWPAGGARQRDE